MPMAALGPAPLQQHRGGVFAKSASSFLVYGQFVTCMLNVLTEN